MKRLCIILLSCLFLVLPCWAKSSNNQSTEKKVFIYHIPDEVSTKSSKKTVKKETILDIISDDVTADTSLNSQKEDVELDLVQDDEEIELVQLVDYDLGDMYSDVLQGYALYDEEEDAILLSEDLPKLNIQEPYKIKGKKYLVSKSLSNNNYTDVKSMEYSIAPISGKHSRSIGGFTAGTMFNQGIDLAELEQSTGVFSRYDTEHFGLYTAYSKTINSTNSNYNDNFYITPELKLNQYFTLKEILSADITKNRKKAEFVVSINPFGKKDTDRLRIEFGANATYDDTNALLKNQFKFSTNFKL